MTARADRVPASVLVARVAAELETLGRLTAGLQKTTGAMAERGELRSAEIADLQSLDLVTQTAEELAGVLRSLAPRFGDAALAVDAAAPRLADLGDRLFGAPDGPVAARAARDGEVHLF